MKEYEDNNINNATNEDTNCSQINNGVDCGGAISDEFDKLLQIFIQNLAVSDEPKDTDTDVDADSDEDADEDTEDVDEDDLEDDDEGDDNDEDDEDEDEDDDEDVYDIDEELYGLCCDDEHDDSVNSSEETSEHTHEAAGLQAAPTVWRKTSIGAHQYWMPCQNKAITPYQSECCNLTLGDECSCLLENEAVYRHHLMRNNRQWLTISVEGHGHASQSDTKIGLHLYRVGEYAPILSYYDVPDLYNLSVELEDWIGSGEYFLVVENVDFAAQRRFKRRNGLSVIDFKVMSEGEILDPIAVTGALMPKRVCLTTHTLTMGLELSRPLDAKVEELYGVCCDLDSMSVIAKSDCPTQGNAAVTVNLQSEELWLDGEYGMLIYVNLKPMSMVRFKISGTAMSVMGIEQLDANEQLRQLAELAGPRGKDWRIMQGRGHLNLKRRIAAYLDEHRALQHRETLALAQLSQRNNMLLYCAGSRDDVRLINQAAIYMDYSLEEVDCNRLKPNVANPAETYDYDLNEYKNSSSMLALYNISTLAQPEMGNQVQVLHHILQANRGAVVLLGSKGQIHALAEMHPWLMDHFPGRNRIEIDSPSRRDVARMIISMLFLQGLKCDRHVVSMITAATAAMPSTEGWDLSRVYNYVMDNITPRVVARLGRLASKHLPDQKRQNEYRWLKPADFDPSTLGDSNNSFEQVMGELNAMVGLDSLKSRIADWFQLARFRTMRSRANLPSSAKVTYHTLLMGNPGTGKTTVAKLMGRIYRSLGILSKGDVIVTDRKRLLGQYIGETEASMRKVLDEARGNVLFVDEAYNLVGDPTDKRDYGPKALDCLLSIMAQPDSDIVVIFAGYEREMATMLSVNPGLESRFPIKLTFPDYTAGELLQICKNTLVASGYCLAPEAHEELAAVISQAVATKTATFGNARWVNDLIVHGIEPAMARRVMSSAGQPDLRLILREDIASANVPGTAVAPKRGLGFCI